MANKNKIFDDLDPLNNAFQNIDKLKKVIIGIAIQEKRYRKNKMQQLIDGIQLIEKGNLIKIKNYNTKVYLQNFDQLQNLELTILEKDQIGVFLGMECSDPNMGICKILIGSNIFWISPLSIEELK